MSTIEKALGSLGKNKREEPERRPLHDDAAETVERSLNRASSEHETAEVMPAPGVVEQVASPDSRAVFRSIGDGVQRSVAVPNSGSSDRSARESAQGEPVHIPLEELDEKGFLTPLKPRSAISEEFRGIKRPLLRNCAPLGGMAIPHANLIMVTSALQGDGKTFCSLNLALSIASEQDKTVLYVDADVLKATAGRTLGVPDGTPGLIDLLEGDDYRPEDVILRTSLPKLRILPAGRKSAQATELLASETMQRLMIELSERYHDRIIVFDSPPLLLTSEASVLASFMGQIVFVASAERTPQSAVRQALEHIGQEKMVGIVMNRASRIANPFGYGYGYGYGYGEEESSDVSDDEDDRG